MANCTNCGTDIPPGVNFCPNCGAAAPPGQPPAPPGAPFQQQPPQPMAMPPAGAPPAKKKGLPTGAKVAIIVGLVVVLLVIGCVVAGSLWFWNKIKAPADVANKFTKAVEEGDLDTAWGYTSPAFREITNRETFDEMFGALEGKINKYNANQVSITNSTASVGMDVDIQGSTSNKWEFRLREDGGTWKIVGIDLDA